MGFEDQITAWVAGTGEHRPLTVTKIHTLLARQGGVWCRIGRCTDSPASVAVSAAKTSRCGSLMAIPEWSARSTSATWGMLTDAADGRRRKVHALIFTAVYSRHMFVWLSYSQTLAAVIAGCEAAWEFFGGGVRRADPPRQSQAGDRRRGRGQPAVQPGWLDYAGHSGFLTDPPPGWPRRKTSHGWNAPCSTCGETSGTEKHSPVCSRRRTPPQRGVVTLRAPAPTAPPAHARWRCSPTKSSPRLLAVPQVYDVPVFKRVKVHRDFHAEVAKALYSLPECWIGQYLDVRADTELVKFYRRGVLVKVHPPRQPAGGRSTDPPADLPEHKTGYALRDVAALIATCASHGPPNVGIYAERILDDRLPWTKMRTVYRLLGLVRRYGADRVEQACSLSLDLDVVSVNKIASMLERATETSSPPALPKAVGHTATRFARDPSEFNSTPPTSLTIFFRGEPLT